MALTATRTYRFEQVGQTTGQEVLYVPGDPGDTYVDGYGAVATVGEGICDVLADNEGGRIGRVEKSVVCAAATVAMPNCDVDVASGADLLTLIPVKPCIPAGIPIERVTFANHYDCTVAAYVAATRIVTIAAGPGADDYYNGALLYVYDGTGAGQVGVVEDTTNGTPSVTMHRPFKVDLDATSKIIIVAGEAVASRGIGFFNRCESKATGTVTTDQGSDDGDYVVFMDFRNAAFYLKELTLPVIQARYLMLA